MLVLVAGWWCCGEVVPSRRQAPALGTFLIVVANDLTVREEGFIWTHSLRDYSPSWRQVARRWQECAAGTLTSGLGGTRNSKLEVSMGSKTLVPNLSIPLYSREAPTPKGLTPSEQHQLDTKHPSYEPTGDISF